MQDQEKNLISSLQMKSFTKRLRKFALANELRHN